MYLFIFQLQQSTFRLDAFSWCNRCPLPVSHHQHFYWVGRVFFFLRAPPHDCLRCTCTKSRLEQTELIALSLFDKYELNCLASEQTFVIFNKFYTSVTRTNFLAIASSTEGLTAKFKVFCTETTRHIFLFIPGDVQELLRHSRQVKVVCFVLQNPQFNVREIETAEGRRSKRCVTSHPIT